MKIHSIAIHNLHSLASSKPLVIDFLKQPLQGCGLFAITGPTGAGKTTILDALTLALYGEIAREGDSKEVMSHGEGQCSAEVIFKTPAGCYKARWALHRANKKADGKFQNAVREIACWKTKNVLATKVTEVEKLVEELVGLNKEQFLKSVLLAQGQFMDFLKGDKNERALLLEKLTGTEIYRGLSKFCFEKHKTERAALEALQKETSFTVLLSESEKEDLTMQMQKARQEADDVRKKLALVEDERRWHHQCGELEKAEAQAQQTLERALAEKGRHANTFSRWEAHSRLSPVCSSLEQWQEKEGLSKTFAEDVERLQQKATEAAAFLQEKEAKLSVCLGQKEVAERQWQNAEPKLLEALQNEAKAAKLAESISREKFQLAAHTQKHLSLSGQMKEQEALLTEVKDRQATLKNWLVQNERDGKLNAIIAEAALKQTRIATLRADMRGLQESIKQTISRCEKARDTLLHLRQEHQAATKAHVKRQEREEAIGEEKTHWKYAALHKKAALMEEKERLESTQQETQYQVQALQFFLEHHQMLEDGKPCRLCGSTVHPYANRDLSGIQQSLQTQQARLEKGVEQLAAHESETCTYDHMLFLLEKTEPVEGTFMFTHEAADVQLRRLENLLKEEADLRLNLVKIRRDIERGTTLIGDAATTMNEEEMKLARLQSDEQELVNEGGQLAHYFQFTANTLNLECKRNGEGDFVNALREKAQFYQQQLSAAAAAQTRLLDLEKLLQNLQREIAEVAASYAQSEAQIRHDEEDHKRLYEAIRQIYPTAFESVTAYHAHLKEATQSAVQNVQLAQQEYNAAQQSHALAELEKTTQETRQNELAKELESLVKMLCAELSKLDLDEDLPAALAQLIPHAERQKTETLIRQLEGACNDAQTLLQSKQTERVEHTQKAVTTRLLSDLEAEWAELQKQQTDLFQQIGRNEQILAQNAEKEAQLSEKLEAQRKQESEVARWRTLNDLIGSSNGDKLSNFAQTLSLEQLLAHANIHLRQLSDRYRLRRKTDSKESLGIQVEDLYLGGALREASSLSGGETFLVSLGLALGLSDMASQKTRIDSLFIDEGFGSLDDDALEDALTTLESLQSRGKTIGIISHVAQLKERIPTQIVVRKKGSGVSSIEVVPN